MKALFILNHAPYGSEHCFNALRLATTLVKRENEEVKIFLMGDAASAAKAGQALPDGYYNLERMLRFVRIKGVAVGVCGTCMDARGLRNEELVEGVNRSSIDELADWTGWADKVLVF